ncbi:MAG: Gfo/Idh/MocA family oxidoreductase [Sphingobacteriales bacterium]|nr:Gfo/Idh/MocA family oxidoreductase [Sphingobacteriales bacterium]OJY80812.1 MAG: oxidoreductase [Sphingobacteriales bacterium 44-15]
MLHFRFLICFVSCLLCCAAVTAQETPLRIAVAGISHGHSAWILGRKPDNIVEVVGIYEPDKGLSERSAQEYKLNRGIMFDDLNAMLDKVKPEAVVAFGSIYDHLAVVKACAPRGIHVMVEKPLAVSVKHALEMEALAKKYNIFLLTDYETSWYPATAKAYQLIYDSSYIGNFRKAVFHHGHQGPREIGVSDDFFNWLTDPVKNGGGAIIDFGCYGANLMTWLAKGERPLSVSAVTRRFKPEIYPRVDDEATIVISYPHFQAILQASWNWPFNRKDMELYGTTGYVKTVNNTLMHIRRKDDETEQTRKYTAADIPVYEDPFKYFADVVKGKIKMAPYSLYAQDNNMMVVRILEAAKTSAATGKAVSFGEK